MPLWRLLNIMLLLLMMTSPVPAFAAGPLVLAAASLQESLTAAADSWAASGHKRPVLSFAASSSLARQIIAGAPADIFISADEPWMDAVADRRLINPKTRASFLGNQLVLITPAKAPLKITIKKGFPLARALGGGRLAMADPDAVPAGKYARQALVGLGVWASVQSRVAFAENVRAALALVERGEAPAGIVYATDARAALNVAVAGVFPARSHAPITYPIALLASSTDKDADSFRRFLISRQGKAIFARYGFQPR